MAGTLSFSTRDYQAYFKTGVSLGKSAAEILGNLRAASPSSAPSSAIVYCWVKHFSSGNSTVEDSRGKFKPPTDKTVDLVKELVDEDPRVAIRYIAESLRLSSGSVWHILRHKLGYRKVCARWVPHILTPENEGVRVQYAQQLLRGYDGCDQMCLDEIVTGDEIWVHFYEPERKAGNKPWVPKGGSPPQIARRQTSKKKVLCTVFFDTSDVVLQKPYEQGKSITGQYYGDKVLSDINRFYRATR